MEIILLSKTLFEKILLYNITYNFLKINNISYISHKVKPMLIENSAQVLNPCTGFNLTYEILINRIYYLVKEGHFSMSDLEKTDWYFVDLLYETLYDEIKKRNKEQEEQNKKQEQDMINYQQMQDFQSKMLQNSNIYNQPNFN